MSYALMCLVLLAFAGCPACGFKIYKERQALMNLLVASGEATEERLYTEYCRQSSKDGNCNLALDGDIINEWTQCASSGVETKPYWQARMETPSYIARVVIHTVELPDSSMQNALGDFALLVSGLQCYRHISSERYLSMSFPCDSVGEMLTIQSYKTNAVLALCEIEVYGLPVTFQGMESGEMEMFMKSCDQSSTADEGDCSNALDRKFTRRPTSDKGCSLTDREDRPFWTGYFAEPAMIKFVKLYSRADKFRDALKDVIVKINENECGRYNDQSVPFDTRVFTCQQFGNYIIVQSLAENVQLSLCQVQVFGYKMLLLPDTLYSLLGCYKDDPTQPDFEKQVSNTWMSPLKCHKICKRLNKPYFGLQNGQVCFCGTKYGRHGKGANCSMPCKDSHDDMCGGPGLNSVYEIVL